MRRKLRDFHGARDSSQREAKLPIHLHDGGNAGRACLQHAYTSERAIAWRVEAQVPSVRHRWEWERDFVPARFHAEECGAALAVHSLRSEDLSPASDFAAQCGGENERLHLRGEVAARAVDKRVAAGGADDEAILRRPHFCDVVRREPSLRIAAPGKVRKRWQRDCGDREQSEREANEKQHGP